METDSGDKSAKIRDYAITVSCIVFTLMLLSFILLGFVSPRLFAGGGPYIYSECSNGSAYVFIGANDDIRDIKCVALDKEFFNDTEIVIGDLSKGDEDVCRFRLSKNTPDPLRFEVWYNGRVQREVCKWQNHYYSSYD